MHNVTNIINELNENNSSNYKLEVLKKHKDDLLLQRVLKMTSDKAVYNYGVGKKTLKKLFEMTMVWDNSKFITLEEALDILENEFCTRKVTGTAALDRLYDIFTNLSMTDSEIITKIINRDLKINVGRSQINKVFKDLITKPSYNRCDTYSDKTAKNINFKEGVYTQLKSDGTYREFTVNDSEVSCVSRSGEEYEYPVHNEILKNLPDSKYMGELTVKATPEILEILNTKLANELRLNHECEELKNLVQKVSSAVLNNEYYILPRSTGNGLIGSDDVPHNSIILELWDMVSFEDYNLAKSKDKKNQPKETYDIRFEKLTDALKEINSDKVQLIPTQIVYSLKEALQITSNYMQEGLEGAIIKDKKMLFKDGTNKHQLKLKLHIEVEMRFTGFVEGNKGSKNEEYFSAVKFQNDEVTIKGQIGVTTMTEDERDFFHENRDKIVNSVATLKCNDLIKATNNDYYALSHVSYIELRPDKNETDTLEKVLKIRDSAMLLESKI